MNEHRGWHSRGYLPHFDAAHAIQAITFHLGDSVPLEKILEWKSRLKVVTRAGVASSPQRANRGSFKRALPTKEALRRKIQTYLDAGHGDCYLRDERIAKIVQDALLHFDGARYRMLEWVVMPNH